MEWGTIKNHTWVYALASSWGLVFVWGVYRMAYSLLAPSCGILAGLNPNTHIADGVFLSLTVIAFSVTAYYALWRGNVTDRERAWLFIFGMLGVFIAFVSVPFNTHDSSYYFGAAQAVHSGVNVYTTPWILHKQFVCEPSSMVVDGISYGPLALWLFWGAYVLGAKTFVGFMLAWKVFMIMGLVGVAALTSIIETKKEKTKTITTFIITAFPFAIWEIVGSGHFDVWWIFITLAALMSAQYKKWWISFPLLALGIWIKFLPLLVVPWVFLWWIQDTKKENWKHNVIQMVAAGVLSVVVTVVSWAHWWQGIETLRPIVLQAKWAVASIFSAFYYSAAPLAAALWGESYHWILTRIVHIVLLLGVAYLLWPLAVRAWRVLTKKEQWTSAEYLCAIIITLCAYIIVWQKSFWPWYVAWLVLLSLSADIRENRYAKKIITWIAIAPLTFYVVLTWYAIFYNADVVGKLWFNWLIVVLWVYPLVMLILWRKKKYALSCVDKNV